MALCSRDPSWAQHWLCLCYRRKHTAVSISFLQILSIQSQKYREMPPRCYPFSLEAQSESQSAPAWYRGKKPVSQLSRLKTNGKFLRKKKPLHTSQDNTSLPLRPKPVQPREQSLFSTKFQYCLFFPTKHPNRFNVPVSEREKPPTRIARSCPARGTCGWGTVSLPWALQHWLQTPANGRSGL